MAQLKHPEWGTEIEVPTDLEQTFKADGWEEVGSGRSSESGGRRKAPRKAADD